MTSAGIGSVRRERSDFGAPVVVPAPRTTTRPCATLTVPASKSTADHARPSTSERRQPASVSSQHAYRRSPRTYSRNRSACCGVHVDISRCSMAGRSTSWATLRAPRPRFMAVVSAIDHTVSMTQTVRLLTPPGTFGRSGSAGNAATYRARCGRSTSQDDTRRSSALMPGSPNVVSRSEYAAPSGLAGRRAPRRNGVRAWRAGESVGRSVGASPARRGVGCRGVVTALCRGGR